MENTQTQIPIVDSTNKDVIKFTQEEMIELQKINARFQEKIFQFGQLYLHRSEINRQINELNQTEQKMQADYLEIQKQEDELLNKLTSKYGEGTLDPANGTFTPTKKK